MKEYIEVIKKASIFTGMSEDKIYSLLDCLGATVKPFKKHESLLRAGDSPKAMGLILIGSVLIVQEDFWGNRNIRARIMPGQVFAESFACVPKAEMDVSVVADENGFVMWLSVLRVLSTCSNACEHHSLMIRNLLSSLAKSNLRASEKLTHVSRRTTREKLLSYLSAEAIRQGRNEFFIPFNRQQLADYLSVERSAMSAELSRMQKEGLIATDKNFFSLKP